MGLVIGSVPYLNEKPLTRWFHHTADGRASGIKVVYEVPSRLAEMLAAGEIAAALVSSFEYFRTSGYVIAPGVSISGQDEILSVRAFSKAPWRSLESLALDATSLTSAALLKIILAQHYASHPAFLNHAPDLAAMLQVADAALLIGDKGMLAKPEGLLTIDVGDAWRKMTGLPFVYAVWMGTPEAMTPELVDALKRSRDWGTTQIEPIVGEEAMRLGCSPRLVRKYLTQIMDYNLDEEHLQALALFGQKAREENLLTEPIGHIRLAG